MTEKLKTEALDKTRETEETILKEAKTEADEMVRKARSSCDKIRREIEKDVQMKTFDFVSRLLNSGLSPRLIEVIHREQIEEFISREKDLDFSAIAPEVSKMVIRTAFPLGKDVKERIVAMVTKRLGRSLETDEEENKDLIAGVALAFGTLVLDGSFANAINDAGANEKRKIELQA